MKKLDISLAKLPHTSPSPSPNYNDAFYYVKRTKLTTTRKVRVTRVPSSIKRNLTIKVGNKLLRIHRDFRNNIDNDDVDVIKEIRVCIGSPRGNLRKHLNNNPDLCKLKYFIIHCSQNPKCRDNPYTKREKEKYYEIFKKRGVFKGFDYKLIKKGVVVADLDVHNYTRMFIAYCIVRYIEDDYKIVDTILALNDLGVDFYMAMVIANAYSHNTGHSFLKGGTLYFYSLHDFKVKMENVLGLYAMLNDLSFKQPPLHKHIPNDYVCDDIANAGLKLLNGAKCHVKLPTVLKYANTVARSAKIAVAKNDGQSFVKLCNKILKEEGI